MAALLLLAGCAHVQSQTAEHENAPDKKLYVFLCFGQSNMEGFPGIEEQDKRPVDDRFQMLAAVDFPDQRRTKGNWYPAVPPLCRPRAGIGPADYFGRTLVSNLPPHISVGVVNVSVAGCKIELFDKDNFQSYASTAAVLARGSPFILRRCFGRSGSGFPNLSLFRTVKHGERGTNE